MDQSNAGETKKINIRWVVSWIFAVFFSLVGVIVIFNSFVAGALLLLAGVILLPPMSEFAKQRWNLVLSGPLKFVIVLVLAIASIVIGAIKPTAEIVNQINNNQAVTPPPQVEPQSTPPSTKQAVTPPPQPTPKTTPPPAPKPTPPPVQEPEAISLKGTGQQASEQFMLITGLSVFKLTHTGTKNFSIWLLDSEGNKVDLLANIVGSFNGSKAVGITKADTYLLDIDADGGWSVVIEQPRPATAPAMPSTVSGTAQQATQLVTIQKGLATFALTHNGSRNFSIWLMDKNGGNVDLLVNTIGPFNGSKAVQIPKTGIYLFNVDADGAWTISH
ncbi:MAG: hypothetical protein AAB407_02150 [Patescibacteria group bacterium]